MQQIKRIVAAIAILALAGAALPSPAFANPQAGPDTARGHVREGHTEHDFNAKSTNVGTNASGTAKVTFMNPDPNEVFSGEVTCLRVVGHTATIGVLITSQPPGFAFRSMIVHAFDSGKFSGDPEFVQTILSILPPPADGACPTWAGGLLVTKGDIIIESTLP